MMKFPYELSLDRLSLLSLEDRDLYEYEHSPFYSYELKQKSILEFQKARMQRQDYYMNILNEDKEYNDMSDIEKNEMVEVLTELEENTLVDNIMNICKEDLLNCGVDETEFNDIKEYALHILRINNNEKITETNIINENILNEGTAPGPDMTYWIPDFKGMDGILKPIGWIGSLAAGILGTGIAGIVRLIMAGKDKAAAKMLEKYMNKLVELTDDGMHKKKSFFSFLGFKGKTNKDKGDLTLACFRTVLEFIEREMAKDAIIAGKGCGLLTGDGLSDALSNTYTNGGLLGNIQGSFKTNIADKLEPLISRKL